MDYQPHDTFAKMVLGKLARGREVILEAELRPKVYADVILRPGPVLPGWTGLLGRVIDTGLTVIEVYHGRPRSVDLCHAQAKGALALAAELKRHPGFAGAAESRVLLLTIGTPRRAMKRCFRGTWETVQPGHTQHAEALSFVHLDLLRLPVTVDTAWAHVAGDSPFLEEALNLLLDSGGTEPRRLLYAMSKEVSIMPELQKSVPEGGRPSSAYRFAKAWELAASRREGRQRGLQEGIQKGIQKGIQEGIQKGIQEGRQEGRQDGIQEGLRKGRQYGRLQALESLLGLPESPVETLSALSLEEIERRIAELTRKVRERPW